MRRIFRTEGLTGWNEDQKNQEEGQVGPNRGDAEDGTQNQHANQEERESCVELSVQSGCNVVGVGRVEAIRVVPRNQSRAEDEPETS